MHGKFHDKAKDASNKLKSYILSISTAATGVFFIALTSGNFSSLAIFEKCLLFGAIFFFSFTTILSLIELRIDATRFYNIAIELEKPEAQRDWTFCESIKEKRLKILNATYVTIILGFILTFIYLVVRIT